jgi:undecaprenyl-diphosphatase
MPARAAAGKTSNYFAELFALVRQSLAQLVRPESHSRRAEAARRVVRHVSLLATIAGVAVIALMYVLDVPEIDLMPPRGTAALWPVRILTDFGRAAFMLWLLAGILFAVALVSPRMR